MKKTAFLQALVLVVLLTASWILLIKRSGSDEPVVEDAPVPVDSPAEAAPAAGTTTPAATEEAEPATEPVPAAARGNSLEGVPPLWVDWINYLQQQSTPEDLRNALLAMKKAVFSMEKGDATARLIELILSRVDLETGMPFRVGPGGNLDGGPTLQVLLADWLGQIDPERSAGLARLALSGGGTQLGPDLFVLHLRNFARGTPPGDERTLFMTGHFKVLLGHQPWMEEPTSAIAEAMDVAVYLQDPKLVPAIAGLTTDENADRLRHASSIALERMIDRDPLPSVRNLLSSPEGEAMSPAARAGFVARLDPVDAESQALLKGYLASPETSPGEAALFLAHFPNMNQTLSHNLLSTNFSNTESAGHMERLQRALETVRSWQADPELAALGEPLAETFSRLSTQVTGQPQP